MVVGFDDLFLGDLLRRPVTTVVQPVEDLGRHAVRLLLQDIAEPGGHQQLVLPPRLTVQRRRLGVAPRRVRVSGAGHVSLHTASRASIRMRVRVTECVEFEIRIDRADDANVLDVVITQPDSDVDIRPLAGTALPLALDLVALDALVDDDEAYGAALTQALFGHEDVRGGVPARGERRAIARQAAPRPAEHQQHRRPNCIASAGSCSRIPKADPLVTREDVFFSRFVSSRDFRRVPLRPRSELRALVAAANPANLAQKWPALAPIDTAAGVRRCDEGAGRHSGADVRGGRAGHVRRDPHAAARRLRHPLSRLPRRIDDGRASRSSCSRMKRARPRRSAATTSSCSSASCGSGRDWSCSPRVIRRRMRVP